MAPLQITYSTVLVLHAIKQGYRYGFDIMDVTGLPSGTVYPALRRLERGGALRSKWEGEQVAVRQQRPQRRYYLITPRGERVLHEGLQRYRGLARSIPTNVRTETADW
jgi:DNA-binding PadR family transcriptional regulator